MRELGAWRDRVRTPVKLAALVVMFAACGAAAVPCKCAQAPACGAQVEDASPCAVHDDQAVNHIISNEMEPALQQIEAAIACGGATPRRTKLAFMAACNLPDATKAKAYFARLPATQQPALVEICLRNRIDPR